MSMSPTEGVRVSTKSTSEHHWFQEPTAKVGLTFTSLYTIAQIFFFVALLGPASVGLGVKIQQIVPDAEKAAALGMVAGFGALFAALGNVVFGRFSDRTTSRWGRRRPWIVGGTVGLLVGLLIVALADSVALMAVGWSIAQLAANSAYGPFKAVMSDQVPKSQRGLIASLLGIGQNIGVLGGTWVAQMFATQPLLLFVAPAIVAIVAMAVFAVTLKDQRLPVKPPRMAPLEWLQTFWVSPLKHPDFAFAWWSRSMITLAIYMFVTFRLFYLQDHLGVAKADAPAAVTTGVMVYTLAVIAAAALSGWLSDKTGRRKLMVGGSAALFGIGTILLFMANSLESFYVVEAVLGVAYGVYVGVDLALVVDVLPNPDDSAKDLGVFNIAFALPQSIAPAIGAFLLGVGNDAGQNYQLLLYGAGAIGLLGGLLIWPIKKVR